MADWYEIRSPDRKGLNVPLPVTNKKMMIKKMEFKTIKAFAPAMLLAAALLFPSCVQDNTADNLDMQSEVGFTTAVSTNNNWNAVTKSGFIATDMDSVAFFESVSPIGEESVETKGVRINSIDTYGSFGTFAYVYSSTKGWDDVKASQAPSFMYNLKSKKIDGEWRPNDRLYYWPAATYRLSFFGYAPYNDYQYSDGTSLSDYMKISGATALGAPVITYTASVDIAKQVDLLTADSLDVPGAFHKPVPMTFKHALSGVCFTAKTKGKVITIKDVQLTGVYNNGTYTIGDAAWTLNTTKSNYSFPTTHNVNSSAVVINNSNDSVFFMLPQILPSGAKLVVTYLLNGAEKTATADFSGKTWVMGKVYTYNLTIDASNITYTFTVTPIGETDAEAVTYTVKSTKTIDYGGYQDVEDVDYTVDDSTFPTGATYTKNSDGTLTVTWPSRAYKDSVMLCGTSLAMRARDSLAGPIDLTTGTNYNGTSSETANCYVINQAGYYCFPANVMGNGASGVVSTSTNGAVYNQGLFIDYDSNLLNGSAAIPISSSDKAVLLWEDSKGLINDLKLGTVGSGYVSFRTMAKNKMSAGNAVIALESSNGAIKWSWHIWCTLPSGTFHYTDPVSGKDSTFVTKGIAMHNDQGTSFATKKYSFNNKKIISSSKNTKIMSVNLGAVERDRKFRYYQSRQFDFTCIQDESDNTSAVNFGQSAAVALVTPAGYTNTLYQWGRKDPFVSGNISTYVSDNTSSYYNQAHPYGTNVFTLSGNSYTNESDGVFGSYPVQENSAASSYGGWNVSDYAVNLQFAIRHPMTFIYNTHSLTTSGFGVDTTPVDWFTYKVDVLSRNDVGYGALAIGTRYDNGFLWGAGYYWHDYYVTSAKTIYDPCPVGYKVAVGYAYTSLTATGTYDYGNVSSYPVGLFFPATGMRNAKTGALEKMGVRGDFWCSSLRYVLNGNDNACYFKSADGEFGHQYADDELYRGEALSLRPVGDDY